MADSNNNYSRPIIFCFIAAIFLAGSVLWSPEIWALPYEPLLRILTALFIWIAACMTMRSAARSVSISDDIATPTRVSALAAWLVMAGLVVWALLQPMETFFYGDGGLLIPQIFTLAKGEPYQYDLLLNAKSSPLTGIILIGLSHGLPDLLQSLGLPFPQTGLYPFHWLSILCLLGLVAGIALLTEKQRRLAFVLYIFGSAGTLLYFGYVEYYTLPYTAAALYFLSGERALRGKAHALLPVAFFLIAVAAHYEMLALAPSLAFLLLALRGREAQLRLPALLKYSTIVLIAGIGAYFLFGFHASDSRIVMPLFPVSNESGTQAYTLLSTAHLRDMWNLLLLLAPVQALALVALLTRQDRGSLFGGTVVRFYLLALISFSVFLFFANTSLGLARDWDIAAPLGLILSLAALAVLSAVEGGKNLSISRPILYGGLGAFLVAMSWVYLNVVPERSAARFETIVALDADTMYRDYAHSGFEALRKYYMNIGDSEKDMAMAQKKIALLDYPSDYLYLINTTIQTGTENRSRYIELQRWMLTRLEAKAATLREAGIESDYSISIAQTDSLAEVIATNAFLLGAYPELDTKVTAVAEQTGAPSPYGAIVALQAYQDKRYADAADGFQQAVDRGMHSPAIFRLFGTSLALQQRYTEALAAIERGLDLYPNDATLLYTYADWLLQAGIQPEDAHRALERAAVFAQDPALHQNIAKLLAIAAQRLQSE